jgi:hypothetical protein
MAMGDFAPVEKVEALGLSEEDRGAILGGNAAQALGL